MKEDYEIGVKVFVDNENKLIYLETINLYKLGKKEIRCILPGVDIRYGNKMIVNHILNIIYDSIEIDIKPSEIYKLNEATIVKFEELEYDPKNTYRLIYSKNGIFPGEDGCEEPFTHQYDEFIITDRMDELYNYKIGVEYKDNLMYLETVGLRIIGKKEVRSILPASDVDVKNMIMASIFTNIVNESLSMNIKPSEEYELFDLTVRFEELENDDTLRLVFQDGNKLFPEEDGCEEVYTHQYDEFISYNEMEEN